MKFTLTFVCALLITGAFAQQDTSVQLQEAEVRSYFETRSLLSTPATVSIIDAKQLSLQHDYSLVPAINTVPGVRMEERSPGSYRLSIRGSLLRSPFGIRNIKIYLDDFPLTDAGGNSYLNSIDAGNVNRLEIIKGPESSIFGANSGGVVIINPVPKKADSSYVMAGLSGGSYGLIHQKFVVQEAFTKYRFNFTQGFQRSDGYRDNSNLKRQYIQFFQQWNYIPKAQLKALFILSDLNYNTPGGLTLAQFQNNPRAARPATATLPGAEQQKAAVFNKTYYGGLSHQFAFTPGIRHVLTLFGSHTDFKNPFISNYETRNENSFGTRTYIEIGNNENKVLQVKWQTGLEAQKTSASVINHGNRNGNKDTLQAHDDLNAINHFYFTRIALSWKKRLFLEAAGSLNYYRYDFKNNYPLLQPSYNTVRFDPQLMPRLAASYLIRNNFAWRASVSRGYSAPTLAEIRSSNLVVNTLLKPETGWNYETGFRFNHPRNLFMVDACVYYFKLEQAIVRRLDNSGNEFFVNSGGTHQTGVEVQGSVWIVKPGGTRFIRGAELRNGFTYNHFIFNQYSDGVNNYNANQLTGTPQYVNVSGINISLPFQLYTFIQYNYTGPIPLNDANSAYAGEYHLVQLKAGWQRRFTGFRLEIFAGADNVLNQVYSLGNDLNAFGARYYNAAPLRNYFFGANFILM
ncbi:MAG: TonB-dependent receptor [Bacteroidota bacterium]